MLNKYDIAEAKKTILKRTPINQMRYPLGVLDRVEKVFGNGVTPEKAVKNILNSVQQEEDAALRYWSNLLDGRIPEPFRIQPNQLAAAYDRVPEALIGVMRKAADRIRMFHERQPLPNWQTGDLGGVLGQRAVPIDRVGVYVPGGTAPLPSSLLMSVVPAQVAGVSQIIVCTPPGVDDTILAAAHICGEVEIYQVGGAQAIAAMAFGTESIPKVDKIVGAGNLFVTLAKQQVFGVVGLDGLAGPTETMVIADGSANPEWVAADLLAQAEHDVLASAILLTPDMGFADKVQAAAAQQLENLSRAEIVVQSLQNRGGIVITPDIESAVKLANDYAAEHLCVVVENPGAILEKLKHAGGIFVGEHSFEVLGDYIAGPSHVMPTGGSARFASPLNVFDFVKITSMIALDEETGRKLSEDAVSFASAEQLTAHAAAAWRRTKGAGK